MVVDDVRGVDEAVQGLVDLEAQRLERVGIDEREAVAEQLHGLHAVVEAVLVLVPNVRARLRARAREEPQKHQEEGPEVHRRDPAVWGLRPT